MRKRMLALLLAAAMLLPFMPSALAIDGTVGTVCPDGQHQWGSPDIDYTGCTTPAYAVYTCVRCGTTRVETVPGPGHSWVQRGGTAATCLAPGNATYVCSRCGETKQESTPALGHQWGAWQVVTQATCVSPGTRERVCQRDSSHRETETVPATGQHAWGSWETEVRGNCITPSQLRRTCTVCRAVERMTGEFGDHEWGEWEVVESPTCTQAGYEQSVCKVSSVHVRTREIAVDPDAHDWEDAEILREATPTEPGLVKQVCKSNKEHTQTVEIPYEPAPFPDVTPMPQVANPATTPEFVDLPLEPEVAYEPAPMPEPVENPETGIPVDPSSIPDLMGQILDVSLSYEVAALPEAGLHMGDEIGLLLYIHNDSTVEITPSSYNISEFHGGESENPGMDVQDPLAPGNSISDFYTIYVNESDMAAEKAVRTISLNYTYYDENGALQSGATNEIAPQFPISGEQAAAALTVSADSAAGKQQGDYVNSHWTVENTGNAPWKVYGASWDAYGDGVIDTSDFSTKIGTVCQPSEKVSFDVGFQIGVQDWDAGKLVRTGLVVYVESMSGGGNTPTNFCSVDVALDHEGDPLPPEESKAKLKLEVSLMDPEPYEFDEYGHTIYVRYCGTVYNVGDEVVNVTTLHSEFMGGAYDAEWGDNVLYPGDHCYLYTGHQYMSSNLESDGKLHISLTALGKDMAGSPVESNTVDLSHDVVPDDVPPPWTPPAVTTKEDMEVVKEEVSYRPDLGGYLKDATVTYRVTATNNSDYALNAWVWDPLCGPGDLDTFNDMQPGETRQMIFEYTVKEADLAFPFIHNVAHVSWQDPESGETVTADSNPVDVPVTEKTTEEMAGISFKINILKEPDNGSYYIKGEQVPLQVVWKNLAPETLINVHVYDWKAGEMGEGDGGYFVKDGTLLPNQEDSYTFTYTIQDDDFNLYGSFKDQGYADGWASLAVYYCYDGDDVTRPIGPLLPEIELPPVEPPVTEVPVTEVPVEPPVKEPPVTEPPVIPTITAAPPAGKIDLPLRGEGEKTFCVLTLTGHGTGINEYALAPCADHADALRQAEALIESAGSDREKLLDAWKQAQQIWRGELDEMYEKLLAAASGDAREALENERAQFEIYISAQEELLNAYYPNQPIRAAQEIYELLMRQVCDLCYVSGFAPDPRRPDSLITGTYAARTVFGDGADCQRITGRNDQGELTYTEILCGDHAATEQGLDAMLGSVRAKAQIAEMFLKAARGYQGDLDRIINARYKEADQETKRLIAQSRRSLDTLYAQRKALLEYMYPNQPQVVNEQLSLMMKRHLLMICQWLKELPESLPATSTGTETPAVPVEAATAEPTIEPTAEPTPEPTAEPTEQPTAEPAPELGPVDESLAGEWYAVEMVAGDLRLNAEAMGMQMTLLLNADGTASVTTIFDKDVSSEAGVWGVQDGVISVTMEDETAEITVAGDELQMDMAEAVLVFRREREEPAALPQGIAADSEESFLGVWALDNVNMNGTTVSAAALGAEVEMRIVPGALTLIAGGEAQESETVFENGALTFTDPGNGPLTLELNDNGTVSLSQASESGVMIMYFARTGDVEDETEIRPEDEPLPEPEISDNWSLYSIPNPIAGFRLSFYLPQLPDSAWRQRNINDGLTGESRWSLMLDLGTGTSRETVNVQIRQRLIEQDRIAFNKDWDKAEEDIAGPGYTGYAVRQDSYDEYVLDLGPAPENPEVYRLQASFRVNRMDSERGQQAADEVARALLAAPQAQPMEGVLSDEWLMDDSGTLFYPTVITFEGQEIALSYYLENWGQVRNIQGVFQGSDGKKYTVATKKLSTESNYNRIDQQEGSEHTEYGGFPAVEERRSSAMDAVIKTDHGIYLLHCQGADINHDTGSALMKTLFESAEYREAPAEWLEGAFGR